MEWSCHVRKSAGKSIHRDEVQQQSIIVINSAPVSNLAQGSHERRAIDTSQLTALRNQGGPEKGQSGQ